MLGAYVQEGDGQVEKQACSHGSLGGDAIIVWQVISFGTITDRPTRTWVFAVPRWDSVLDVHCLFED
jgi:hypothetical protein